MKSASKQRVDWRVMVVALAFAVTICVLLWTVSSWNKAHAESELSAGVTTGISPANTVYPPRVRSSTP
jgi:hypothetical protein